MKRSLFITVFLLISCLSGWSHAQVSEGASPSLVAPTLKGVGFNLSALRGKVVVVHFWATWCSACREEMPALEDFYQQHHAQGVEAIAVSLDGRHDRDDVIKYMHDFHFPASMIGEATVNSFGTPGALPVTYVIDKAGVLQRIFTPDKAKLTKQNLDSAVLPLLGK